MRSFRFGFVALMMILVAESAHAEGFISPFIGFNFGGDSANCLSLRDCEERRANFGLSMGIRRGIFGLEQDIAYAPDFFGETEGGSNAVLTVMSNLMLIIPAGPLQPYGVVGLGLIRSHMNLDSGLLEQGDNALGYDIGGGLNIYFGPVGIRGDVRRMKSLDDITLGVFNGQKLEFWRGSAGVTFKF